MTRSFITTIAGLFAVLTCAAQSVFAADANSDTRAADITAIQQLVVKYAHVYDSLDVEGYVSVFAEDAKFTFTGNTLNGRADIRKFIEGAKARRDSAPAATPATKSYHSLTNTMIELESPTKAHHRSYWQVLSCPTDGPCVVSNMGYYDDVVVKQNGQWLIQSRNIP